MATNDLLTDELLTLRPLLMIPPASAEDRELFWSIKDAIFEPLESEDSSLSAFDRKCISTCTTIYKLYQRSNPFPSWPRCYALSMLTTPQVLGFGLELAKAACTIWHSSSSGTVYANADEILEKGKLPLGHTLLGPVLKEWMDELACRMRAELFNPNLLRIPFEIRSAISGRSQRFIPEGDMVGRFPYSLNQCLADLRPKRRQGTEVTEGEIGLPSVDQGRGTGHEEAIQAPHSSDTQHANSQHLDMVRKRRYSNESTTDTFMSAPSFISRNSYRSAQPSFFSRISSRSSYYSTLSRLDGRNDGSQIVPRTSNYFKILQSKSLWPIKPSVEKDWSGRGQHVEFKENERRIIHSILIPIKTLGSTNTAIVEAVQCRRILLARKTIRCGRHFTKEQAIEEVAHLNRLSNAHIVQVIGTFTIGDELAILIYPVAEHNLETFIQSIDESDRFESKRKAFSLASSFGCLAHAVDHIHENLTKHMDIKPKNILMRDISGSENPHHWKTWKPYIADFGIARSYTSRIAAETEGPTMFTRKYAAPEVVDRQPRGLPADIFSLGCVFLEMLSVLTWAPVSTNVPPYRRLEKILENHIYGDHSYQANIDAILKWNDFKGPFRHNFALHREVELCRFMLSIDPNERPTASELKSALCQEVHLRTNAPCCGPDAGPDKIEAWKNYAAESIGSADDDNLEAQGSLV